MAQVNDQKIQNIHWWFLISMNSKRSSWKKKKKRRRVGEKPIYKALQWTKPANSPSFTVFFMRLTVHLLTVLIQFKSTFFYKTKYRISVAWFHHNQGVIFCSETLHSAHAPRDLSMFLGLVWVASLKTSLIKPLYYLFWKSMVFQNVLQVYWWGCFVCDYIWF
jgi:hypothetical protein